ncbi:MAG: glycosyltransferase family 1 protein [Dehalococcoidia bacterium]|nr:glycosyltransferase family 1 protein [Dehalococcoidia bacterium]
MKVLINLSPAVQRHAGLGRYAEELTRALVALGSSDEFRIFYTDPLGRAPAPPLDALPRRAMRWSNKPWRMAALLSLYAHVPLDSLFGDAEIFHATDHLLPRLHRISSVFTLHDLAFLRHPEAHLPLNRWFLRLAMPLFLRRANAVICVSQYTKGDAVRSYGLDDSKIYVIPEGVHPRFHQVQDLGVLAATRARYHLPERFILFVSTIEPRKNLVTLWEAYRLLRSEGRTEKLVVVGQRGWLYQPILLRLRELGLEDQVVFPGYVDDEDLPAIYSLAECFCFPSLFEGFGLAPLEAMASGCPVVCSNASSLPEVCGDAAILVPPTDVSALTSALRRLLDDPALRDDLRARGLRQSAQFTWRNAAERTLGVYRAVAEARRSYS